MVTKVFEVLNASEKKSKVLAVVNAFMLFDIWLALEFGQSALKLSKEWASTNLGLEALIIFGLLYLIICHVALNVLRYVYTLLVLPISLHFYSKLGGHKITLFATELRAYAVLTKNSVAMEALKGLQMTGREENQSTFQYFSLLVLVISHLVLVPGRMVDGLFLALQRVDTQSSILLWTLSSCLLLFVFEVLISALSGDSTSDRVLFVEDEALVAEVKEFLRGKREIIKEKERRFEEWEDPGGLYGDRNLPDLIDKYDISIKGRQKSDRATTSEKHSSEGPFSFG